MNDDLRIPAGIADSILRGALLDEERVLHGADIAGVEPDVALRRHAFQKALCDGVPPIPPGSPDPAAGRASRDAIALRLGAILMTDGAFGGASRRTSASPSDRPSDAWRTRPVSAAAARATGLPAGSPIIPPALAAAVDDAVARVARLRISPAAAHAIRASGIDPARLVAATMMLPQLMLEMGETAISIEVSDDDPPSLLAGTIQLDQTFWIEMDGTLWLDATLPSTVLAAIGGQPVSAIISHPTLDDLGLVIGQATHEFQEGRMRITTRDGTRTTIGDLAQATPDRT